MTTQDEDAAENRFERFVDLVLFIAIGLPLVFGSIWLSHAVQLAFCPADAFFAGTLSPNLQWLCLVGFTCCAVFAVRNWLLWNVPALGSSQSARAHRKRVKHRLSSRAIIQILLLGFAGLTLVGAFFAALSAFCLSDDHIELHAPLWSNHQDFHWHDINSIHTSCSRAGRGWNGTYVFWMSDGTSIDILTGEPYFSREYSRIARNIEKARFVFDASAVVPDCGRPDADLLRRRP